MVEMLAYCGLDCNECEAKYATEVNDDERRREVAVHWTALYDIEIEPQAINCMGCKSDAGLRFYLCEKCPVRRCARRRRVETCAHCPDYPCDRLDFVFRIAPGARQRLDQIHRRLKR
jgi:hypothetical protein